MDFVAGLARVHRELGMSTCVLLWVHLTTPTLTQSWGSTMPSPAPLPVLTSHDGSTLLRVSPLFFR